MLRFYWYFRVLGTASKPNRRLTGGSVRFRPVSIVLNNDNRPEPDGTARQPAVEFWSRPLVVYTQGQFSRSFKLIRGKKCFSTHPSIRIYFLKKMDWNSAFMVPKNTNSFKKRSDAPFRPLEIIYFCKFRPRRIWNYAYLARKIQNFLRQGALLPCNRHIRIYFDRKGTDIVHLWSPKIHKEGMPLETTRNHIIL